MESSCLKPKTEQLKRRRVNCTKEKLQRGILKIKTTELGLNNDIKDIKCYKSNLGQKFQKPATTRSTVHNSSRKGTSSPVGKLFLKRSLETSRSRSHAAFTTLPLRVAQRSSYNACKVQCKRFISNPYESSALTSRRGMTPTPVNLAGNIASVITPKAQNSFLTRANSGNPYRNLKFKKTPQSSRSSSANVKEDKLIRAEARVNSIIFKRQQK